MADGTSANIGIVKLNNVRLAFPSLWTPTYGNQENTGEKKFRATFIFPPNHPQRKVLHAAIVAVAKEKWGAKADAVMKSLYAQNRALIQPGDAKANYEGYEGNEYITASNKTRPTVIDADRSPLAEEDGKPYSGCYVNCSVEIWAQDNKHGKRINAGLRGLQFLRDGDAFSGGAAPADADEFDDISDTGDDLA